MTILGCSLGGVAVLFNAKVRVLAVSDSTYVADISRSLTVRRSQQSAHIKVPGLVDKLCRTSASL